MDNLGKFVTSLYIPFQNHVLNILSPHADPYEMLVVNRSAMEKITVYSHLLSAAFLADYLSTQIFFLPCGFFMVLRNSLGPCEMPCKNPGIKWTSFIYKTVGILVRQGFSNAFLIGLHKISDSLL